MFEIRQFYGPNELTWNDPYPCSWVATILIADTDRPTVNHYINYHYVTITVLVTVSGPHNWPNRFLYVVIISVLLEGKVGFNVSTSPFLSFLSSFLPFPLSPPLPSPVPSLFFLRPERGVASPWPWNKIIPTAIPVFSRSSFSVMLTSRSHQVT